MLKMGMLGAVKVVCGKVKIRTCKRKRFKSETKEGFWKGERLYRSDNNSEFTGWEISVGGGEHANFYGLRTCWTDWQRWLERSVGSDERMWYKEVIYYKHWNNYVTAQAMVKVGGYESPTCVVEVGMRQGCSVFEGWGNGGGESKSDGRKWKMLACSYADDSIVLAYSEEDLQRIVSETDHACARRKLKVNAITFITFLT